MKKYNITVNGTTYTVEVEEAGVPAPAQVQMPAQTHAPAPAPQAPVAEAVPKEDAQTIKSPMPGTVVEVKVTPGQAVKSGDVLLILEAMKMENEIYAPTAGTVDAVLTAKGASVNAGDVLITLK